MKILKAGLWKEARIILDTISFVNWTTLQNNQVIISH